LSDARTLARRDTQEVGMADKHFSTSFEAELASISQRVLDMGRLVQAQVAKSSKEATSGTGRSKRSMRP
jgi:hypothetical protein